MKTNFQRMRERLEHAAGIFPPPRASASLERLRESEWSPRFESLMRNRLVMGALRYGPMAPQRRLRPSFLPGLRKRLAQYGATGNAEFLVDVANLALLEFEIGHHPRRHFAVTHGDHAQPDRSA
jgi:hypothetical protein